MHTLTHTAPYPLSNLTGAPKVDDPYGTPLRVTQEDILRLEVTVDDVEGGVGEKEEGRAQLLGKLAGEVERDSSEVGVSEELIEVVGEELEDQAEVVAEHEVTLQSNCTEERESEREREREREREERKAEGEREVR